MHSSPAGDIAAPTQPLAPGWEEEDVVLLREAARLAMAHMQALTMEITAQAERVAVGDLTPMSRAAATESSLGFTRAARCMRLCLAMKAHARNPNAKARDVASLVDGLPPALPPLPPGYDRRFAAAASPPAPGPAPGAPPNLAIDTEAFDLPEMEREREVERDSWGSFPAMISEAADGATEGALARILAATINVRRRLGDAPLSNPSPSPKPKADLREVAPNGRPPHPIKNPGGYPNYQAYRSAYDTLYRQQQQARKYGRKPKARGP